MPLGGFRRTCAKRGGGVRSLRLVTADQIASATYDSATDSFTEVQLRSGAEWSTYDFVEQSCSLTERCGFDEGSASVAHRIAFSLHRADAAAIAAAEELAEASGTGVAALVETPSGEVLLVGYSVCFGNGRPMRVESIAASTGTGAGKPTEIEIVLHSVDNSLSRPFTGTL